MHGFTLKNIVLMAASAVVALLVALPNSAEAATNKRERVVSVKKAPAATARKKVSSKKKKTRAAPDRFAALVVDASTGRVLYEKNAGSVRYPASLTKMMTLYLTFDALKKGKLSMDDGLPVSAKAASQPQTNISLSAGDSLPVRSAIESLVVRSANDSSLVLAEALGDTEWNFALMMTKKARELGMKNTVFRNPNGLPDNKQHTTAYDMARLAIALRRDFPEYYPFFKLRSFNYDGITYPGHNRVLDRYPGADGVKTGFINSSGFNLVTSVKKDGYNIVAVIMGGTSASGRDNMMVDMLDRTFAQLESKRNAIADQTTDEKKTSGTSAQDSVVALESMDSPQTLDEPIVGQGSAF